MVSHIPSTEAYSASPGNVSLISPSKTLQEFWHRLKKAVDFRSFSLEGRNAATDASPGMRTHGLAQQILQVLVISDLGQLVSILCCVTPRYWMDPSFA